MSALGTLGFVVAILFSIGLHEFGHFITAKKFGMKVHQFFIGFGPKVWSVTKGDTEYGVKALPLGGFVRIAGMNPYEEVPEEDRDRVFQAKPAWQRAIVLAAGSFTHFLVALVITTGVLWTAGSLDYDTPTTTVSAVSPELDGQPSPAARAGFKPRDQILSVDGKPVTEWKQFTEHVRTRPGQEIVVVVRRGGQEVTLRAIAADHRPDGTKTGYLGVGPAPATIEHGPISALSEAAKGVGFTMKESVLAFKTIFDPATIGRLFKVAAGSEERRLDDPATLVGIGDQAGDLARTGNFAALFYLIAGLNVFIGVANLMPLPPLDGGHLAVLAVEKIRRKPVDMRTLMPITITVIAIFGSLFLLLLFLDIARPLPTIPG